MGEQDWLDFLAPPTVEQIQYAQRLNNSADLNKHRLYDCVRALMNAVIADHPTILVHCTEEVVLRMIALNDMLEARVVILKSSVIVIHLSDECIVELASHICSKDFAGAIATNAVLVDRFISDRSKQCANIPTVQHPDSAHQAETGIGPTVKSCIGRPGSND